MHFYPLPLQRLPCCSGSCRQEEFAPRTPPVKEAIGGETASFGSNLVFNKFTFTKNISNVLKDKTIGYVAQVKQNGTFVIGSAYGYAAYLGPYDSPAPYKPGQFWPDRRMETMQLSSTITGAALLKVLELKGGAVTVDSPVFPFLPANWKLGPNVKLLTFRHLLSHGSGLAPQQMGLAEPETDLYENLRDIIAYGIPTQFIQDRNGVKIIVDNRRQSLNYALMRVLIPYLQHGKAKYEINESKGTNAGATATDYVTLVQQLILTPSGIVPAN
jgi:hypothetical protein